MSLYVSSKKILKYFFEKSNFFLLNFSTGTSITAKLNDKCPYKVMTEVLQRLPGVNTVEGYEALADLFQKEDGTNSVPSTH